MGNIAVGTIKLNALPKTGRGASELSADDKALASAIVAAASGDEAALIGVEHKTREDAEKAQQQVKRLMKRSGLIPDGKATKTAVVPDGKAFKVAVHFGAPVAAKGGKAKANADAPTEDAAPAS